MPNLSKQRPRTSSCQSPAQAKKQSAKYLTFVKLFRLEANCISGKCFNVEFFDQPNREHTHQHGTADDAVHMETLEAEHFLNAVPIDHFGFDKYDSKSDTDQTEFQVLRD